MIHPTILYNLDGINKREQLPHECQATRTCSWLEKMFYTVYSLELKFDEQEFDNALRNYMGLNEGEGISTVKTFRFLQLFGIRDTLSGKTYKIKSGGIMPSRYINKEYILGKLTQKGCLAFSVRNTYGSKTKTISGNKWKFPGEKFKNSYHALLLLGWDSDLEAWVYINPHRENEPEHISHDDLMRTFSRFYYVKI